MPPIRIDAAARRARLPHRQHLAPACRAADPVAAAGGILGFHATDPMTVYLAALARTRELSRDALTTTLYDDRALLRVVGMRTTMFAVPRDLAAVIHASCSRALAARERPRLVRWLHTTGIGDPEGRWLADVEAETVAALERLGETTATELAASVPRLAVQIPFGEGREWQGTVGVGTRVLFLLAAEGRVIRGRPKGTVVSSLYRWVAMDRWLPGGLIALDEAAAREELVRRWLAAYGPGTLEDLRWWTGWPLRDVRHALAGVDTEPVDLDGTAGLVLAGDAEPAPDPGPWAALLPSLDPAVMGWAGRDWYLGAHRAALFDRNGNAGPTAWWGGRVVGGWAQRRDGEIVVRLLEDVGAEAARALDEEAARIASFLGPVRVIPRFRTPLETMLSA